MTLNNVLKGLRQDSSLDPMIADLHWSKVAFPIQELKSLLCLDFIFQIQKLLWVLLSALHPETAHLHKQHLPSFSPVSWYQDSLPSPLGCPTSLDSFLLQIVSRTFLKASGFSHSWSRGSAFQPGPQNLGFSGREPRPKTVPCTEESQVDVCSSGKWWK